MAWLRRSRDRSVTGFDYVVIGIVAVSLAIGAWRGLVGEVLSLLAWILAAIAAWFFGAEVGQGLFGGLRDPLMRFVAGHATVVIAVLVLVALVKLALRGMLKALGLTVVDRLLGVSFGVVRGLAIVVILVLVGGLTSAPRQDWWRQAVLAPPLETVVLAGRQWLPPEMAKRVRFR